MAYKDIILAAGPSNYWTLNESAGLTAADSAGSAPGTISGGVTLAQAGALADGTTAMAFNGTSGQIRTVGAVVALPVALSIELWLKTSSAGTQIAWTTNDAPQVGQFFTVGSNGGTAYIDPGTTGVLAGVRNIADGVWHHVVATMVGTALTVYVDGAVDNTGSYTARTTPGGNAGTIGSNNSVLFWSGGLDDVAIYPRALTPTEISDHYAARLTTAVPSAGCDHTTVWSKHLSPLSAPTVESERAYLSSLYGVPGGSDMSTLVSRWLQAITCGATSLEATLTPETVQTAQASAASADTLTVTFPGATGNGRGIVVGVISSSPSALPAGACSDNKGNPYTRILSQTGTANSLAVYLCPTGVGGPVHTITLAPALGAIELMVTAIEVRGVGAGLALDASGSTTGTSSTPASTSGAVTTTGILGLALAALDAAQTSLVVSTTDGQTGWRELAEDLH